jgi:hypothetical protein
MAGANPNWGEVLTTTLKNRSGAMADNVANNNALLYRLKSRGKQKPVDGGETIVKELQFAQNDTVKRYSGYDALNISPSAVLSAAEFDFKQVACAVTISGLEMLKNSGSSKIIDLMTQRIENAEKSMLNTVASDCYSDGTADSGKQIGGLQLLVSDTGLGTVGGINAANWAFWRNQVFSCAANSLTPSKDTITQAMNALYMNLTRGSDSPDLIVSSNEYYGFYLGSLQQIQRITSEDMARAGFSSLKFMKADVVFDGGTFGAAPSAHMYFLNTDYLFFQPHKDRNFVPIGGSRFATNQDSEVRLMAWAGNMTTNGRQYQGCIKA